MVKYRFILFVFVIAVAILQLHRIEEQLEFYFILSEVSTKAYLFAIKLDLHS